MGQAKTKLSIIFCGLDNSGKTTIINSLKPEKDRSDSVNATVGYNVETFRKGKNVTFTAFDMGGSKKFRNLWESYYRNVQGVVFVIDSADSLRMVVVRDELEQMLKHPDFSGDSEAGNAAGQREAGRKRTIPFLFFANKSDVAGATSAAELSQILGLSEIMGDRPFNIFSSCAVKGVGLDEGIDWLQVTMIQQQREAAKK